MRDWTDVSIDWDALDGEKFADERQAARKLQQITPGHHPPTRRAKGEWWAAIEVTPDIELRARGLDGDDLAALESIADAFRALLSRDF